MKIAASPTLLFHLTSVVLRCPLRSRRSNDDMTRGVIQRRLLGQNINSLHDEAAFLLRFSWAALTNLRTDGVLL